MVDSELKRFPPQAALPLFDSGPQENSYAGRSIHRCRAHPSALFRVRALRAQRFLGKEGHAQDLRSFLNILRQNADRDFLDALPPNLEAHGTDDPCQLLGRGNLFFHKMLADGASFPRTANHAQKSEGTMDPRPQDHRVMSMPPRHDQTKSRRGRPDFRLPF